MKAALKIMKHTCVNWKVFENNLAAVHEKNIFKLKQTHIYVGFTVLELSK